MIEPVPPVRPKHRIVRRDPVEVFGWAILCACGIHFVAFGRDSRLEVLSAFYAHTLDDQEEAQ